MNAFSIKATAASLGLVAFATIAPAAPVGTDNASAPAYADGWADGDDGSITGEAAFGSWLVFSDGKGSFAGVTVEDSTDGGSNLNTDGKAFGLYADSIDGTFAHAYRWFDSTDGGLAVGQTFSIDLKVNFRGGHKGVEIRDGDSSLFKFIVGDVGSGEDYTVENATTGSGSIGNEYNSNSLFNIALTQTTAQGGSWTITRSGGVSDVDSGSYTGQPDNLKLFSERSGGGAWNNLWANNLSVVPEPATATVLGVGALALLGRRRASN